MQTIVAVVTAADPDLSAETITEAVVAITTRASQQRQLAWALFDRPELLTGEGADAGLPAVLRLIEVLCQTGSTAIVRPACPRCGRVALLGPLVEGRRACTKCSVQARSQLCARCGVLRQPASRDKNGGPLCSYCLVKDPANHETCVGCGRMRPVHKRSGEGPACYACRARTTTTCAVCGRSTYCTISKTTNEPRCRACRDRWARCSACRSMRQVRGGTASAPLCASCTQPDPLFWRACPCCGQRAQLNGRPCVHCELRRRLRELLGDDSGAIRQELQGLYDNLANYERPHTVISWLEHSAVIEVLFDLGAGKRLLTHAALDELGDSKPLRHLRSVLVATGALAARDEQVAELEAFIAAIERDDSAERQLLQRYALWHQLRRLRQRNGERPATSQQAGLVRANVRAAATFLDWITARGLTLSSARQGDLDAWLTSSKQRPAGSFVRWAAREKLTTLRYPTARWGGPTRPIDAESRWKQARWLLRDDTVKVEERVAGLLVLLYAQRITTISRLTLVDVETSHGHVQLRLGDEPVRLPAPLDALVLDLVARRRGQAALGDDGRSIWLFPGGRPGQPLSAERLGRRLSLLGLQPGQARSSALFQLATDLPAAVLARMLGISIGAAVQWQRACSGDWVSYAADYSRRPITTDIREL